MHIYEVQASLPPSEGTRWRQNVTTHIVAPSFVRAVELHNEAHPDAEIHGVTKRNHLGNLIIDPDVVAPLFKSTTP